MNDITTGPGREPIDLAELHKWRESGTIITDDRRRRPYWFDGRFLDAAALNAEQNYFLARQADYGRAAGFGVIQGLGVQYQGDRARRVTIAAGQGLTPSGAQVLLTDEVDVDLAAVAEQQRLDAGFGLAGIPGAPAANRSGLYILALRPVEFSADLITAYPTSLEEPRSSHDGSIVEATAVTLIPYRDMGASSELERRRSQVAREIFFEESLKGQPEDVLPLAMLALDHGVIRWLDTFMVRREIAQRQRGVWGLGIAPRALRAAHLRQYADQLEDLLARRGNDGRLMASEHFSVLPPAGPMPASGIVADDFTHSFFPAEMDVELSLVPGDELPALLEEAMRLPPIDLEVDGEAQQATAVMVLVPLPRNQFESQARALPSLRRELPPAQPEMLARRRPIAALNQFLLGRSRLAAATDEGAESAWRSLLAQQQRLWFVRRRNLNYKAEVVGDKKEFSGDEKKLDATVAERAATLKAKGTMREIVNKASSLAIAELNRFLASPPVSSAADLAIKAALNELARADSVDTRKVREVTGKYAHVGEGLERLVAADETLAGNSRVLDSLVKSGRLVELDRLASAMPVEELKTVAERLVASATGGGAEAPKRVAEVIAATSAAHAPVLAAPSVLEVRRPLGTTRVINRG